VADGGAERGAAESASSGGGVACDLIEKMAKKAGERSIKPFVIGRKNFLFANTPLGAQGSTAIYSLIETAKETGLDPYRYLVWVLKTAPALDQTVDGWAEPLLPANAPADCHLP